MKQKYCFLFLFLFTITLSAQKTEYHAELNVQGLGYSGEQSPFWMHSNTRGRIDEMTNLAGWASASVKFLIDKNSFAEIGAGGLYQNGYTDKLQLDEAYFTFKNHWLTATVGRKQMADLYLGLSASNQNILWSLNARPMPGIRFYTPEPVFIKGEAGLGFKASYEEYLFDDDRYVKDAHLHHKSFHIVYKARKFEIIAGLQHFVQWGGTSPVYGRLPQSFQDYLQIVAGREGSDNVSGEEANALGNHLGSYEIYVNSNIAGYDFQLIYNHLFEDGSGRVLRNTPDGRYGIFIKNRKQGGWVDALMYEFYYTKNQSAASPTSDGIDNYFNNNLYRSGWTYEQRILGVPFITLDNDRFRVNNNQILVHHLGFTGRAFTFLPYKFLTSYRRNYGGKGGGAGINNTVVSSYLDIEVFEGYAKINLLLGTDFTTDDAPNFAAGLRLHKELF